jgi:glutamate 5-kinase
VRVTVKIGTSSLTDESGRIDVEAVAKVAAEVAAARDDGHEVLVVTSGAVAAGLPALGIEAANRPRDARTLQAVSAVGQAQLVQTWSDALAAHGLVAGQVLLAPLDFMVRTQYLHARSTVDRLLELGVVPVVNENDATADDEIRFGDNDRIAALLAQLAGCDLLLLLTDAPGLMDADPRLDERASLIEEIVEVDQDLERLAGGAGTSRGSGGMASKLAAAKMASWAGVRAVIAQADRPGVVADALAGVFAVAPGGTVVVDAGAARALLGGGRSLLAAGVERVEGSFTSGAAVEIMGPEGVVAKGIVSVGADELRSMAGQRSADLDGGSGAVVHADDLVVLPG